MCRKRGDGSGVKTYLGRFGDGGVEAGHLLGRTTGVPPPAKTLTRLFAVNSQKWNKPPNALEVIHSFTSWRWTDERDAWFAGPGREVPAASLAAGLIKIILIRNHFPDLAQQMAWKVELLALPHSGTFAFFSEDLIQLGFLRSFSCYVKNPFASAEKYSFIRGGEPGVGGRLGRQLILIFFLTLHISSPTLYVPFHQWEINGNLKV